MVLFFLRLTFDFEMPKLDLFSPPTSVRWYRPPGKGCAGGFCCPLLILRLFA